MMQKFFERIKKIGKEKKHPCLSVLSLDTILQHLDSTKRLLLCSLSPQFSTIDKRTPLELSRVKIGPTEVQFNEIRIILKNRTVRFFNSADAESANKFAWQFDTSSQNSKKCVLKVVSVLFAGRLHIRIKNFESEIEIPIELHLDVFRVYASSGYQRSAKRSANIFRKVDCVMFLSLRSRDDVRHSWIQNSERLEFQRGDHSLLVDEMPNFRAKTIYINLNGSTTGCLPLIRVWIQNKRSEDGAVLHIRYFSSSQIPERLFWSQLHAMGFVLINTNRRRLRLENNMEAILSMRNDRDQIPGENWSNKPYFCYLSVAIARSGDPF